MYNQNKLLLRFAQEHILLILKKGFENIFILTQREKCTGVPMYTMHRNLHTVVSISYQKQVIYGYYQEARAEDFEDGDPKKKIE